MKSLFRVLLFLFFVAPLVTNAQEGAPSCAELQANFIQYQSCATNIPFKNSTNNTSGEIFNTTCIEDNFQAPTWFFMKIKNPGNIDLMISQVSDEGDAADVDYVLWGPFSSLSSICGQLDTNTEIGCSYSPSPTEAVHLQNGLTGEFYILLVDNYANVPGQITITQTGGTGSSDCSFLSSVSLTDTAGNEITQLTYCSPDTMDLMANVDTSDFEGNAADLRFNYKWYRNGVLFTTITNSTSSTNTITASVTGTYKVELTAYDSTDPAVDQNNLPVSEVEIQLSFISAPNVSIQNSNTHCLESVPVLQLTNTTIGGSTPMYQWLLDGNIISGATTATYTPSLAGSYSVRASNDCGMLESNTITLYKQLGVTIADNQIICEDGSYEITSTVTNSANIVNLSYQWFKDGILINGATAATYVVSAENQDISTSSSYTLSIYEQGLCPTVSNAVTITITGNPLKLKPYKICVDINNNVINPAIVTTGLSEFDYSFVWYNGFDAVPGNEILTSTGNSFTTSVEGEFSVKITNITTSALCTVIANFTAQNTFVPFSVKADPTALVAFESENTVTAIVTPLSPDFEYQLNSNGWQESNVFVDVKEGIYTLTVRNKYGCGEISTEIIVVDYPKFFTPNGDGFNDYWNVGGRQGLDISSVYIFDKYGKLIKNLISNDGGWDGTLNGHPLPSDDYWFRIDFSKDNAGKEFMSHFSLKR